MKLVTLLFCLAFNFILLSNDKLEHIKYDWESSPTLSKIDLKDTNISAVYLKNVNSKEFMSEGNNFNEYVLIHKKIKLLTERGIEIFNKVYIPSGDKSNILIQKARVINSKGEVIILKESDIREGTSSDGNSTYLYFAFEGIDINSEIEYIFLYRKNPVYKGVLQNIQSDYPQENVLFEVIAPNHLQFDFVSYNGLDNVIKDTAFYHKAENKSRWFLQLDKVDRLAQQASSAHEAYLQYVGYKLSRNFANGASDMFSYGELSNIIYSNIYQNISKKDDKFIKTLDKKFDLKKLSKEEIVRKVENEIKNHLTIIDGGIPENLDLEFLWEKKVANERTVLVLMANIFKLHDIDIEIILTSNRFDFKFDKVNENWGFAANYALYFPELKKYTSLGKFPRLGMIDYFLMNNYGLFIKTVEVNGQEFGSGKIKFIPANDYLSSSDTLRVGVKIEDSFDEINYDVYHSVMGYKASSYQPIIQLIEDQKDKEEFTNSLIDFLDDDGVVIDLSYENFDADSYGLRPLTSRAKLKSSKFFEKASANYIFKIGELIGPQMQMYDNYERTLPIEDYFNRHYYREITFEIPQGYSVKNLTKLDLIETYENEKGEVIMAFHSRHSVSGNVVTVLIDEYYTQVEFPLDIYDDYRRVINAAADFNKISLILEKQ